MNAEDSLYVTNDSDAALEFRLYAKESMMNLDVKVTVGRHGEAPDANLQRSGLEALWEKLSCRTLNLPLGRVSVECLRGDLTWSFPRNFFCTLGALNPLELSLRGLSLTGQDFMLITQRFGSLEALDLLAPSEFNPADLTSLKALPHLRRMTLDASICFQPADDGAEEPAGDGAESSGYNKMFAALLELCGGPIGRENPAGNRGRVVLEYSDPGDDREGGFQATDLENMAWILMAHLRKQAGGKELGVEIVTL